MILASRSLAPPVIIISLPHKVAKRDQSEEEECEENQNKNEVTVGKHSAKLEDKDKHRKDD